jgi:hypothetical protein
MGLLAVIAAAACSKSAGNPEKVASPPATASTAPAADVIDVPKGPSKGLPSMGGAPGAEPAKPSTGGPASEEDRFKLKPNEGKLAIQLPADAKVGAESIARITVTPGAGYHVNTEYPVKLTLAPPQGVTLAKSQFVAGGHDKAKGDADALDDNQLAIAVKLTPTASGGYTINGDFKFAVCDADQCLAKKEAISIAVAAK